RTSSIFEDAFKADGLLGERTKQLPLIIKEALIALGGSNEEINSIVDRVPEIGRESKKRSAGEEEPDMKEESEPDASEESALDVGENKQLIFIDRKNEARQMAEKLL